MDKSLEVSVVVTYIHKDQEVFRIEKESPRMRMTTKATLLSKKRKVKCSSESDELSPPKRRTVVTGENPKKCPF